MDSGLAKHTISRFLSVGSENCPAHKPNSRYQILSVPHFPFLASRATVTHKVPFLGRHFSSHQLSTSCSGCLSLRSLMLRDVIGTVGVLVPVKELADNRGSLTPIIANHLLTRLSQIKVCECGYLLSVTKLLGISHGQILFNSQHIIFTVEFRCRTFLPVHGEIMTGVVHRIMRHGVFIRSGPMNIIYLSLRLMPNYHFVPGENPAHVREDMSRVEVGVVVRFMIFAVKWVEDELKEARVLASIDGDGLGPVSLNGLDGVDL